MKYLICVNSRTYEGCDGKNNAQNKDKTHFNSRTREGCDGKKQQNYTGSFIISYNKG